ncbi:MAG: SDR family oxidoreductase [Hamadaea sp.]|uniref:SDR family oxidoreductase n=1 Tax=Hamadaea sp. TaxID=2024425 RepID=UPI0017D41DEE|nr:SDR family oxidoreductase [Hamadaea sp.]NUR71767.1 SDR family oxidoreductase [Hamadaea sp.]NUT19081.1 SDR family oxidoreductase [Hamadaea sp.]
MALVLITGGTGTLGRHVAERVSRNGDDVRVLSRHPHPSEPGVQHVVGDLATGRGIAEAVTGVDVIAHCAGGPKGDEDLTRTLVTAARRAGEPHIVSVSVVGADRVPMRGRIDRTLFGYFAMKLATERVVQQSGLPWTVLRASQFFELIETVASTLAKSPVVPTFRGLKFQPVDVETVADHMAGLIRAEPAGLAPDVAGPDAADMAVFLREYLRATGKRRAMLPIPVPGAAAHAIAAGAITAPDRAVGRKTWAEFLRERRH